MSPWPCALIGWMFASTAWAGKVEDQVSAALVAIQDGDFEAAEALLVEAEEHAVHSESVVLGRSLASIHFYRGVLEYYDGDREEKTLENWRYALLADQSYAFDSTLVADREPMDLFEALRQEVSQRPHHESGVSDDMDDLRVFVDGRLMHSYDVVVAGRHLVQVFCPDHTLHGSWVLYGDAPDYYGLCVDEPEDPGEPVAEVDVGPSKPVGGGTGPTPRTPRDIPWAKVGMLGGGGALVLAGATTNFVWVNPIYSDIEDARDRPATVTRAQADTLSGDFNVARYTTIGLIGVGAATVGASFFVSDSFTLVPAPGGAGVIGRF